MKHNIAWMAEVAVFATAGFLLGRIHDGAGPAISPDQNPGNGQMTDRSLRQCMSDSDWSNVTGNKRAQSRGPSFSQSTHHSKSPIVRMGEIIHNPNPADRTKQWIQFVKSLKAPELEDVILNYTLNDEQHATLTEYYLLLNAYADLDPHAALQFVDSTLDGEADAKKVILRAWATRDPVSAADWLNRNELPQETRDSVDEVMMHSRNGGI